MAKNEEEQNNILPQSLGKLEIVPASADHHASANLNPFLLRSNEPEISSIEREKIFGPPCHCSSQNSSSKVSTNKEFLVKKCAQFKPRKRHEFILKQPMLKTFVRCLHHCHKETKNVMSANERNYIGKNSSFTEPVYDGAECDWSLRNDFAVDFKTLNLSEAEHCTSSDLHKSNSFRYPQSERKLLSRNQDSPLFTPSNDRINQQNISCSQQAMWKPSTNSDVTTDELACYFETIVHIPKKMSQMAEMMYI